MYQKPTSKHSIIKETVSVYGMEKAENRHLLSLILDSPPDEVLNKLAENIKDLAKYSLEELTELVGATNAFRLLSAIELGKRGIMFSIDTQKEISSPMDVYNYCQDMQMFEQEHVRVILLNTKNYVISVKEIGVGTVNCSILHPRDVFKPAIKRNAANIVLVHNHPSGDPTPSQEDIEKTKKLIQASEYLSIVLLDHIIIGSNTYESLKELGHI